MRYLRKLKANRYFYFINSIKFWIIARNDKIIKYDKIIVATDLFKQLHVLIVIKCLYDSD